jgi:hypothetical protein
LGAGWHVVGIVGVDPFEALVSLEGVPLDFVGLEPVLAVGAGFHFFVGDRFIAGVYK